MSVEFWAGFFQAAGLEPEVAASYASIFTQNKIQPAHLPDIDRDALREMGISPMGDILTILKYIKIYCPLSFKKNCNQEKEGNWTHVPENSISFKPCLASKEKEGFQVLLVTSPTTPRNEELLLYQFRNIQESKIGCCGLMRSNHLRNKWHCSPIDNDRVNMNMESVNTITMGPELLPPLQTEPYNEDINRRTVSAKSKSSIGNSKEQLEGVCNQHLNNAGTSNTDRNSCQENSFREHCNAEDTSHSLTSRILLSALQDETKSRSAADNVELCRETATVGPDAFFRTPTSPCFSSSPQHEDPELEVLRDPTLTQHTEQYYLAWADRRKRALSFPGFMPSFLQES